MTRTARSARARRNWRESLAQDLRRALLVGIWACFGLLMLMPFVVTFSTAFPWVTGKVLYARSIIDILFCLWALLALLSAEYRPPRSWLLRLIGIGLVVACVATLFGVSAQRSLWSTYERMQGVVDSLHWFAFAVVLCSVVRTPAQWRRLFSLNLAVSMAMTALATLRFFDLDFTYLQTAQEAAPWRISAAFGNPTFLGAYALVNLGIAAALLAWSFGPADGERAGRHWGLRALWLAAALCNLQSLMYSGSLGSTVALLGGVGFATLLYALFGRLRAWRIAGGVAAAAFATACVVLMAVFFTAEPNTNIRFSSPLLNRPDAGFRTRLQVDPNIHFSNPLLNRLERASIDSHSSRTRIAAWGIALEALAERPLAGWGPENYVAPFGRYAEGLGATMRVHDKAHNELLEHAATRGVPGVLAYLALWLLTFAVLVRAARAAPATPAGARGQILTLCVGGVLMGDFIVRQTLFNTGVGQMQYLLLLCYAAGAERDWSAARPPSRLAERLRLAKSLRLAELADRLPVRIAAAAAAIAAAALGLASNHAIYAGSQGLLRIANASSGNSFAYLERTVQAFPPLANFPRKVSFVDMARNWRQLRRSDPERALRMLEIADRESAAAIALEPENWLLRKRVAQLYMAIASTEPQYREIAAAHRARAIEMSPNRANL